MDLIDRAAAIETLGEPHPLDYNRISAVEKIRGLPSVEAVQLDKLCEWLAGWDIQVIPCYVCKSVFHLESCPHGPFDCGDAEHLKMLIKKGMEGLDGTD